MSTTLNEQLSQTLIEGVKNYGIPMLDPQDRVAIWTACVERIQGNSAEEFVGTSFACFYPPEEIEREYPEEVSRIAREEGHFEEVVGARAMLGLAGGLDPVKSWSIGGGDIQDTPGKISTVLVADDSEFLRGQIQRLVEAVGCRVRNRGRTLGGAGSGGHRRGNAAPGRTGCDTADSRRCALRRLADHRCYP